MSRAELEFPFASPPEPGETQAVVPGLEWLRMPLPIDLNHINLWLLADGDGTAIVDTGIHDPPSRAVWERTLDGASGRQSVSRVIVTHLHPDHVGCAGWLCDRFGVGLWMTREEYMLCRILVADTGRAAPDEGVRFYRAAGFADDALDAYRQVFGFFGRFVAPLPEAYERLHGGDVLEFGPRRFEVLIGNGHSPEHACLFDADRNLLISGDQILPSISSNVSVFPTEPHANPLADWLDSLARLRRRLPEDVLVLPAHGLPFRGAHARLDTLIARHREQLDRLLTHCREPRRAVDTFAALFRRTITNQHLIMATGEAIAHLNYLVHSGEMAAEEDGDGVTWYVTASS